MTWANKYIGRHYDKAAWSCWSLVRDVQREQNQFALPDYADIDAEDSEAVAAAIDANKGQYSLVAARQPHEKPIPFLQRAKVQEFDVVILNGLVRCHDGRKRMLPSHCGLVVGNTHVLHVEFDTATVCEMLKSMHVRDKLVEFYRPMK